MAHKKYSTVDLKLPLRNSRLRSLSLIDPWPLALAIYDDAIDWIEPLTAADSQALGRHLERFVETLNAKEQSFLQTTVTRGWLDAPAIPWESTMESIPITTGTPASPYRKSSRPKHEVQVLGPVASLLSWWQADAVYSFENVPKGAAISGLHLLVERRDSRVYKVGLEELRTSVFDRSGRVCCHVFNRNQHVILPADTPLSRTLRSHESNAL